MHHLSPKEIWDSLKQVHHACGFTTCLALHEKKMHWQTDEQLNLKYQECSLPPETAGVSLIDEDVILALTEGLPDTYSSLIVALDSIPPNDLTLANVATWLLNEEICQDPVVSAKLEQEPYKNLALQVATVLKKKKRPVEEITCFNCEGKGHYQADCPSPKQLLAALADGEEEDGDTKFAF